MRTETKTYAVYKFDELSEKAQQRVFDQLGDLNVDHEWWDFIYEDAKGIGLEIEGFDTDRANYIKGKFFEYPHESAKLILKNHGEGCDTYVLAKKFLDTWEKLTEDEQEDSEELCLEFERAIKEEYLHMLRKDYEYLTSREAVIETIEANEYEFTEDGNLYR